MRRRARELAAPLRIADMRRLWGAQVLSDLGDWAAVVAVAALVLERTGSATLTGSVWAVSLGPTIVAGPFLATLGDRLPRRSVMVGADVARAVLAAAMALPVPIGVLYVLLAASALAAAPFRSARAAIIPEVVSPEGYHDAQALRSLTEQFGVLGGYAVGGGLVAAVGPEGALVVNAGTFACSAMLLWGMAAGRVAVGSAGARSARDQVRGAAVGIVRQRTVFAAIATACVFSALGVVGESLAVVFAVRELGRDAGFGGLLAAAVPVGSMVAGVIRFDPTSSTPLLRLGLVGALSGALAGAAFAFEGPVVVAMLGFAAVGAMFTTVLIAQTLAGALLPAHQRASAFGLVQALMAGSEAAAALAGGVLAEAVGVRQACVVAAAAAFAFGVGVCVRAGLGRGPRAGPWSLDDSSASRISSLSSRSGDVRGRRKGRDMRKISFGG